MLLAMTRPAGQKTPCLTTAAALSQLLQAPLGQIREALRGIDAKPSVILNGLEYFDEAEVTEACRQRVRGSRK